VLNVILRGFLATLAPILPHMAEDAWQALPYEVDETSVFQAGFGAGSGGVAEYAKALPDDVAAEWVALRALRDTANKALEEARTQKTLGASLEAKLLVHTDDPVLASALAKCSAAGNAVDSLNFVLLTSQVEVMASADAVDAAEGVLARASDDELRLTLGIARADGTKCERCWNYSPTVGDSERYVGVCNRCDAALDAMEFPHVTSMPTPAAAPDEATLAA